MNTPDLPVNFMSLGDSSDMNKCTRESHEASKLTAEWSFMEYLGIQETGHEYALELRNCKCGSTLAKEIDLTDA